jgi:DNA-binding NtrC family response regulator
MTTAWRSLVRRWEHFTSSKRTVLAITRDPRCQMSLRIFGLEEGWRILFAGSVDDGLRLQYQSGICVLIYDRELPGIEWRHGLGMLLRLNPPVVPIVLSNAPDARLRAEVVRCGGYDLARNPLDPASFVPLVNGALALAEAIESLECS